MQKKIYDKYKRDISEYKNERMILYHNRIVATYTDKTEVMSYCNPDGTLKKASPMSVLHIIADMIKRIHIMIG